MAEKYVNVTVNTKHAVIRHNGTDYRENESFVVSEQEAEALAAFVEIGKPAKKPTGEDTSKSEESKDNEDWKK